jgi:hypothetical protein
LIEGSLKALVQAVCLQTPQTQNKKGSLKVSGCL